MVGDDAECVVIDAPHDVEAILAVVGDRRVKAIVCTHAHDDHVRVAPELRERTGAPILLHPDDRPLWELTHPDLLWDVDLSDGQVIEVGGTTLQVLHTPGHAPGRGLPLRRRPRLRVHRRHPLPGRPGRHRPVLQRPAHDRGVDPGPAVRAARRDGRAHRPRRRHHDRRRAGGRWAEAGPALRRHSWELPAPAGPRAARSRHVKMVSSPGVSCRVVGGRLSHSSTAGPRTASEPRRPGATRPRCPDASPPTANAGGTGCPGDANSSQAGRSQPEPPTVAGRAALAADARPTPSPSQRGQPQDRQGARPAELGRRWRSVRIQTRAVTPQASPRVGAERGRAQGGAHDHSAGVRSAAAAATTTGDRRRRLGRSGWGSWRLLGTADRAYT